MRRGHSAAVLPAANASRALKGSLVLQGVLCRQPAALTLHTADAFGNICTEGGHEVAFVHQSAASSKAYKVRRMVTLCGVPQRGIRWRRTGIERTGRNPDSACSFSGDRRLLQFRAQYRRTSHGTTALQRHLHEMCGRC